MAKKPKNPLKKSDPIPHSNEGSNSATVFKTLFGEISEQNSYSASLFSDNNPFRRKLESKTELGLGSEVKEAENEAKEQKKRKKEKVQKESSDLDAEIVEESKKLKRIDSKENEKNDNSNLVLESRDDFGGENEKKKKRKKRKRDEVEAEYEAKRYGVPDEMEENNEGSNVVVGEKRKKMDDPEDTLVPKEGFDDESKLLRTVFVGNLPLKIKKKELLKEFGKFGEVESVRIRSVPIVDGKIPRKGAIIRKQFNENGNSVHAYIVFKTEGSAQESLSHNMALVGGNHIRVDRACPPRKKLKGDITPLYDNKRTVFVGNLPFDVKDEEVYQLFSSIKNLENSLEAVRVIRDAGTSLGKGIAYVLFKTTDAAKSIAKRNLRIRNRELRLSLSKPDSSSSSSSSTPSKRKSAATSPMPNTHSAKKFSRTPDSDNKIKPISDLSYQGLRATKLGAQKKAHTHKRISGPAQSKSQPASEKSSGKKKRPSVAARKEKALRAAKGSEVVGKKRKFGNRTPENSGQKKKARKFR
ncbi:hypothetical protein ACJIZ3_003825 [Penstemon smallii]|uniref:RRM domain-containing protein n=1 Tax=Penstemon smallii TaxID=265156 RepID=A0ABD3S0B2_9LAMI